MAIIIKNNDPISLESAQLYLPNLFETVKTTFPRLSESEWLQIINIAIGLCPHCHDDDTSCQCWNDE